VVGPGAIGERERAAVAARRGRMLWRSQERGIPLGRSRVRCCVVVAGFVVFRAAAVWDRSSVKMRIIKQHPVLYDRV
jgi:hypothetical protein